MNAATTTITASPSPSVFGQKVTFTAKVAASLAKNGTPKGFVTFEDGGVPLATVPLSYGTAVLQISSLAAGSHTITAVYGGNLSFAASTGSRTQVVNKATTSTTLTASTTSSTFGQTVTFKVGVGVSSPGSGTPTGSVTLMDGGTALETVVLTGGQVVIPISTLTVGSHTITVLYGGDANFKTSSSKAVKVTVKAATATKLVSLAASTVVTPVSGAESASSLPLALLNDLALLRFLQGTP